MTRSPDLPGNHVHCVLHPAGHAPVPWGKLRDIGRSPATDEGIAVGRLPEPDHFALSRGSPMARELNWSFIASDIKSSVPLEIGRGDRRSFWVRVWCGA